MEKVNELIDQLQELKNNHASLTTLLYYTQLLHAEITRLKTIEMSGTTQINVSVILPSGAIAERPAEVSKTVRFDIPELVPVRTSISSQIPTLTEETKPVQPKIKPAAPLVEIPERKTAIKNNPVQKEINEAIAVEQTSMNEVLREQKTELGEKLSGSPVQDLRIAIGVNDKFHFITELFKEDFNMYERSVKAINSFSTFEQAENWIERELQPKLGWKEQDETVQSFYAIVRKRFS
jgi:hypothetical protein